MPEIKIPRPFLVMVDDVGWWIGRDGSKENQPFRTGMPRDHVPEDYKALAALGEALGMRIPAGFVLCEWDGANLLRRLPSATWMGNQWQAPFTNDAYKEEAAAILKDAASWIEPALHGIGHEFWTDGRMDRSEFHTSSGRMRPGDAVKKHLEYFFKLMAQNDLGPDPRLFIPPALNHGFGDGEQGFHHIARSFGIRIVTLRFQRARCRMPPQYGNVGWECGVVAVDRSTAPVPWNQVAPVPRFDPEKATLLPLHWANILHEDPGKNMDVVTAWVREINGKIKGNGWLPARDLIQFLTQFLHVTRSKIQRRRNTVVVDMGWIHEVPGAVLGDAVFFSADTASQLKIDVLGTEKVPPASLGEARFIKVRLPDSGKIVFHFR